MFWDTSSLVPLLVPELRSAEMEAFLRQDHEPAIWWASQVECQSAVYRRLREKILSQPLTHQALGRLQSLVQDANRVAPSDQLLQKAGTLLAAHPLRASDALQLAAALIWFGEQPKDQPFVCLDQRLRDAAQREGFALLPR